MSVAVERLCWDAPGLTSTQKLVLARLGWHADETGTAWPSVTSLATSCCLSVRAVQNALRDLENMGYLRSQPRTDDSGRTSSNSYVITPGEGAPDAGGRVHVVRGEGAPDAPSYIERSLKDQKEPSNESARAARPLLLPDDFWQRFVERCGPAWGLQAKLAARCKASGLVVPMPEQSYLMAGSFEALQSGVTEAELLKLADFIAAGGLSWRGAAWQHVSKNFLAELSKALDWDGVSDPRQLGRPARAPRPEVDETDDTLRRFERGNR